MKFKVTKKEMKENYRKIISIGYCDAQFLLKYESPIAYSTSVEGWACDYYDVNGVLISTGYSPLDDKNARHDYDLIREYDNKARKLSDGEERRALLEEFINKVIL